MSVQANTRWTEADIPDLTGRTAVVTGANTGIGFETARLLAARGATVVLACRSLDRARRAAERLEGGRTALLHLDLASLASIRTAATELRETYDRIDLLINNAGVVDPPGRTEDGFETNFGINHLGPFAFTGLILDRLLATPDSRIVAVSSFSYALAEVDLEESLGGRNRYPWSKLATLMFTHELQRRLAASGAGSIAVAAHPGLAKTEVLRYCSPGFRALVLTMTALRGHSPAKAALPTLRAATDPAVTGGQFYGPATPRRGRPVLLSPDGPARDEDLCGRLWDASAERTGVAFPV
jgi:NAD(P)-dependent dehydrogenase (short-subunit alcohol dehydrogenase family)